MSLVLDDTEVDLSVSLRKIPSIESVTRSISPPVHSLALVEINK